MDNMDNRFESDDLWTYDAPQQFTPEPPKKKNRMMPIIAVALCCSILGASLGAGGLWFLTRQQEVPAQPEATEPAPQTQNVTNVLTGIRENSMIQTHPVDTGKLMSAAEVYAANVNSTVGITTSITTNYWGYQTTAAAAGSGFVLSDDGYILTNYHVVENSDSISVRFYDGKSLNAVLIGYDESNDIAVLKVEAANLSPVIIGDSGNMNVGDDVIAIGNPLGELTFSLTAGAVSALNREVTMSSGVTMNLIQTDCAINSGNSGGALFNLYGEVIGITNAKYSSSSNSSASIDNIGFAIPINDVWPIISSIIEKGYISKPYIGVSVSNVSAETQSYGLPQGAAVKVVAEDSPAAAAGLKVNDIITAINGTAITGSSDLVNMVNACSVGDVIQLSVYRSGSTFTLTLTVGEKIQSALEEKTQSQQSATTYPNWGYGGNFGR